MSIRPLRILKDDPLRTFLIQAWKDSRPGETGGREQGGFILMDSSGKLSILRWSEGIHNGIFLPPHASCKIGELDIVATFHTHPNTGNNYLQEPSMTDKRAVRDDPDLKGEFYVGEYVIAQQKIYLISPNGQVEEVGDIEQFFGTV